MSVDERGSFDALTEIMDEPIEMVDEPMKMARVHCLNSSTELAMSEESLPLLDSYSLMYSAIMFRFRVFLETPLGDRQSQFPEDVRAVLV